MTPNRNLLLKILFPLLGLTTLLWFLIRVLPKPSRAAYPCMRVAAPLASSFVLWLLGIVSSWLFLRQAGWFFRRSRYGVAAATIVAGGIVGATFLSSPHASLFALTRAAAVVPNSPVGTAKGVNPGRVVWVHDSTAARWAGVGHGHIWESGSTDQFVVDRMMLHSITSLAGMPGNTAAWDTLFRYFNSMHGNGNKGYSPGEKIAIKTNFVFCIFNPDYCSVDTATYSLYRKLDYMNTSPMVVRALLRQLVYVAGVAQADISVGDPLTYYPNEYYDSVHAEFPDVHYIDHGGKFNRTRVQLSTEPMYFSCRPVVKKQDLIPRHYTEATYLINLANMKSHGGNGITAGAKNHFGSFNRIPNDTTGYYDLHASLASSDPQAGKYRVLVDIMGNRHLGGKTMLYLVDGLYAGNHNNDSVPHKWPAAPFNGGWTSSLFASQDPVAIESVLFDIFKLDTDTYRYPAIAGAEDYLLEAALADNPPSGTFYDPDHATATTRLKSLGVYEHWNNAIDRKYSRNLGTGNGIELVTIEGMSSAIHKKNNSNTPSPYGLRRVGASGNMELTVPGVCGLQLALFDSRGRVLGRIHEEFRTAGHYQIGSQLFKGGSVPLAAGNYVLAVYDLKEGRPELVAKCGMGVKR